MIKAFLLVIFAVTTHGLNTTTVPYADEVACLQAAEQLSNAGTFVHVEAGCVPYVPVD
jgi:hypothetical protein